MANTSVGLVAESGVRYTNFIALRPFDGKCQTQKKEQGLALGNRRNWGASIPVRVFFLTVESDQMTIEKQPSSHFSTSIAPEEGNQWWWE